ncbi:hypothetical protein GCM10009602_26280 [Nocardiopsis tropica]
MTLSSNAAGSRLISSVGILLALIPAPLGRAVTVGAASYPPAARRSRRGGRRATGTLPAAPARRSPARGAGRPTSSVPWTTALPARGAGRHTGRQLLLRARGGSVPLP